MSRRPKIAKRVRAERLGDVQAEAEKVRRVEAQAKRARGCLRQAMAAADREGVSFPEIAEAAGVSVSTVKRDIRRVRRGL